MKKLLPVAFLFLAACELIVDVDVPREKSRIVLNSVQRLDSTWNISLSRSVYILETPNPFPGILGASVIVTDDQGNTINFTDNVSNHIYKANVYPVPGRTYKVTAEAQGFDPVDAEFTMPPLVEMTNVFIDSTALTSAPPGHYAQELPIEITFNDPPGVENYYTVRLYMFGVYRWYDQNGQLQRVDSLVNNFPIHIDHAGIALMKEDGSWFSDKTFDGETLTLHAKFNIGSSFGAYRYELSLGNVSKDHYRYMETLDLSRNADGDPFAQPAQVHSNINNGFGVFGGITYDTISWKPEK